MTSAGRESWERTFQKRLRTDLVPSQGLETMVPTAMADVATPALRFWQGTCGLVPPVLCQFFTATIHGHLRLDPS